MSLHADVYVLRLRNLYNICVEVSKQPNELMMEEWMICDFIVFSTLFQLYQDYKGCEHWKSRKENPQKLTQLSSRSHPRHLVGKRTAQKDITIDTTMEPRLRLKIFPPLRIKVRTARSAGQHVTLELLLKKTVFRITLYYF